MHWRNLIRLVSGKLVWQRNLWVLADCVSSVSRARTKNKGKKGYTKTSSNWARSSQSCTTILSLPATVFFFSDHARRAETIFPNTAHRDFQTFHRTSTRLFLMISFGILRGIFAHRRPKLIPSRMPDVWALLSWTKRQFSFLSSFCSFFRNTVFHRYFGDYAFFSFTSENWLITD